MGNGTAPFFFVILIYLGSVQVHLATCIEMPISMDYFFFNFFCLINIGQSYALHVSVCSGIALQPAHCIVLLKNLNTASISSPVLREIFKFSLLLMRRMKSFQFVYLLLRLGCVYWFRACAVSVIKTWKWSEDGSKHNFATAKPWGIPFATQESTRSGSIFLSDGQYVGCPIDGCFKLFLSIVLSSLLHLGVMSLDPQFVCLAL
jgi:hypothetical protein